MDLTVIIADSDDLRVENCVKSIDESVDILVSLNDPSPELTTLVKSMPVRTCFTPKKGLARALNNGVKNAAYEKIVIIDSDCTFHQGTLKTLYNALDQNEMARGIQITKYTNPVQEIISKAREFHGNTNPDPERDRILAYKPLGFRRSIAGKMRGTVYDDSLRLSEDFEMNQRREQAGIGLAFLPQAIIYHAPIPLWSDLKSAFKYGTDRHTMVKKGLTKPKKSYWQSMGKLKDQCIPRHGIAIAGYMLLWTAAYDAGYHLQKHFNINKV